MQLFELVVFEHPLARWLIAAAVALGVLLAAHVIRWLIIRRFRAIALRSHMFADDAVVTVAEATRMPLLLIPAVALGLFTLPPAEAVALWARTLAIIAMLIQAAIWVNAVLGTWIERYRQLNLEKNAASVGTARVISIVARLVLYATILLLILDNIPGIEVTPLIASLGIGGLAIGLAVQNILTDLFASLSIALDKPFVVGDFIVIDDMMGTVDQIGLRSTRLKSLSGEQLIFANGDLLNSRIRNYQRMEERRVVCVIGVLYETTPEQLRAIPAMLREAVEAQGQVRLDRAHFKGFGDFSLNFELVYFVLSPDYNRYMDIQQAINLAIVDHFAAAGVGFAYPTQQIYLTSQARQGAP